MAEGLGLVASGMGVASLGIQIGSGIIKLKNLWSDVKDAPEKIEYLIEEIEAMNEILSDMERSAGFQGSATRPFQLCTRVARLLNDMLSELETKVTKRKRIGGLKAVLSRATIDRLRDRLKTAQSMLNLALTYTNTLSHRRHEDDLQQFRQLMVMCSQSTVVIESTSSQKTPFNEDDESIDETTTSTSQMSLQRIRNVRGQKRCGRMIARFQTPSFFSKRVRVLELWSSSVPNTWGFYLRPHCIVPQGAEIFKLANDGNVEGMRQLFEAGLASPFDVDKFGWTVLDVAAIHWSTEACQFLIDQGADPNISAYGTRLVSVWWESEERGPPPKELIHMLEQRVEMVEDPFEDPFWWESGVARWHPLSLQYILKRSESSYMSRSDQEIADFISNIYDLDSNWFYFCDVGEVCQVLFSGRKVANVVSNTDYKIGRLFFLILRSSIRAPFRAKGYSIPWIVKFDLDLELQTRRLIWNSATDLLVEFVKAGVDLHGLYNCHVFNTTLLLDLIRWAFRGRFNVEEILVNWLLLLKGSGVDLMEYGHKEKSLHTTHDLRKTQWLEWQSSGHWRLARIRLLSFEYGPEPQDWKFLFAPNPDPWFIEFWDMVDHPERAIPGAWNDFCHLRNFYPDDPDWQDWWNDNRWRGRFSGITFPMAH